ncbi:hypothetical protein [Frankia sp. Cr2]|uniref:hypothetical protein n=1 Tax=Frankia sp. Cr2 TaxID=3073932 RepID=UPI002AD3D0AC|nr:hypothetical protein [Frankia sp. Cr2]
MWGRMVEHGDCAERSTLASDELVDRVGLRRGRLNSMAATIYAPDWMRVVEGVVS